MLLLVKIALDLSADGLDEYKSTSALLSFLNNIGMPKFHTSSLLLCLFLTSETEELPTSEAPERVGI